jgi:ornithine cyclodeaminase/alanine dehydrogenase-like protein (mu-crystallin family)
VTSALPPETLILTRGDVSRLMSQRDWLDAVESGFRASASGEAVAPPPMAIEAWGGSFHAKGAAIGRGRHFVALKLNGNFPGNPTARGLPTVQGAVLLCDGDTGSVLAIIDSIELTLRRTAAATALAARHLARPDSSTILVCGCGEQAAAQLAALRAVLPLRRATVWDRDSDRAQVFARTAGDSGIEAEAVRDLPSGERFDVVVTATTASTSFIEPRHVGAGTFVAAVGADSPDKSELHPDAMRGALVIADVLDQCAAFGDLRHALTAGTIGLEDVHAELAELVAGTKPGRRSDDQITIFDSTGTALEDVAAAAAIYAKAATQPGIRSVGLAD